MILNLFNQDSRLNSTIATYIFQVFECRISLNCYQFLDFIKISQHIQIAPIFLFT